MRPHVAELVLVMLALFILADSTVTLPGPGTVFRQFNVAALLWTGLKLCYLHGKAAYSLAVIATLGILLWRDNAPDHRSSRPHQHS